MLLLLVCGPHLISKRLKERRNLKKSGFKRKAAESAAGKEQMCLETPWDRQSTAPRPLQPGDHGLRTVLTLP